MERIVLGFDGTRSAFVAVDWVAERAARSGCQVDLVTVDAARASPEGMSEVAVRDAERRVMDRAPESVVTSRRVAGRMPQALVQSAKSADLLVIGARRSPGARSALSSRLSVQIVAGSPTPTVVVADDWTPSEGSVVVGVDDDDSSSAALGFAAAEAEAAGVGVTLVHAWQTPAPTIEGSIALIASPIEEKSTHRRLLERAFLHISDAYPSARSTRILVHDTASAALLSASEGASVLVLGTHHRGRVRRALLGSVGREALQLSRVPVCVVPAVAPEA
jgi:nucleotide-binding universal stress UspA family protein